MTRILFDGGRILSIFPVLTYETGRSTGSRQ
jgi:hypothetical protein